MSRAAPIPTFPEVGAPISVLIDFDGTISLQDVGDTLLSRLAVDQAAALRKDQLYEAGVIGSRELIRWDMEVLPRDVQLLLRELERIPLDETFAGLVRWIRDVGAAIEVVSDGLGFHVERMLARMDLADLPVATNAGVAGEGGEAVTFPYGHPACFVCGTCKRERVLRHQEAGRVVVFVGDGASDRYAVHHTDIAFAKDSLADWCAAQGIPYQPWDRLSDVTAWLEQALRDGRLPADATAYPAWAAGARAAQARPDAPTWICGPEAWGPGATLPRPL